MITRQVAAGTERGGQMTSEAMMPRHARASRATAMR
jgi:hypothetical protein